MKSKRLYLANWFNSIVPSSNFEKMKERLYRWAGVKIGKHCEIFQGAKILGTGDVTIGDNVFIGHEARIMTNFGSRVEIDDYTIVGSQSLIVTGYHPIDLNGPRILSYEGTTSVVRIRKGACLGTRCTLLPGLTMDIMSEAVAGSVITHDVPSYTRVGGVPARIIKKFK